MYSNAVCLHSLDEIFSCQLEQLIATLGTLHALYRMVVIGIDCFRLPLRLTYRFLVVYFCGETAGCESTPLGVLDAENRLALLARAFHF